MLKIFNDLQPFFEDNYRRINVREYARIRGISAPTASTLLSSLESEGLLDREKERNYVFYHANSENQLFIKLLRTYWHLKFQNIGLIDYLDKELINPLMILFGSFAKAEISQKSDIDLAIFTISKKKLDLQKFENLLKREIQIFIFKNRKELEKNNELLNSILNGFILSGSW